ncbi:Alpha-(1,3)-fucosyltransferase 11 [Mortierella sp. AD032]|nr:Alpha-(1,3)-fucosyltransferase 11 [Mortierella sp. AD032]
MAMTTNIVEERQDQPKEYPILWWTKWFNLPKYEGQVVNYCDLPYTCKFTLDRSRYDDVKVIIIHASSFKPKDVPNLDDIKSGSKALVLNTLEAPSAFQIKSQWTDIFTHRWSYSFGTADFVETYFRAGRGPGSFIDTILAKPVHTIQEKNTFRNELAPIAWIVSSCTSENGRRFYIKQLLKYINIDIYGHCMTNKDWPNHADGKPFSDREIVARYKFYLSIENSNCDDYVTEKIERPYAVGVVPILDGPKDYSRFLPTNHSSIRLDEFATPEQLAIRIHQLDQDDAAYSKYLDYKELRTTEPPTPIESFLSPKLLESFDTPPGKWGSDEWGASCGVCKLAHDMAEGNYQPKVMGYDSTCSFEKWVFFSWVVEFYWWIIVLVILGIFAGVAAISVCRKNRKVQVSLQTLKFNLTPRRWRAKADYDSVGMQDYQLLTSTTEH